MPPKKRKLTSPHNPNNIDLLNYIERYVLILLTKFDWIKHLNSFFEKYGLETRVKRYCHRRGTPGQGKGAYVAIGTYIDVKDVEYPDALINDVIETISPKLDEHDIKNVLEYADQFRFNMSQRARNALNA